LKERKRYRRKRREREREGRSTSIVSVVNPRNDLGETLRKEKRVREKE